VIVPKPIDVRNRGYSVEKLPLANALKS
jgi:hypothetical protein